MIHISGDWYIDIDEHSYNLQQYAGETIDKDGNHRMNWKNVTYHGSLDKALIQFHKNQIRDALAERNMELKEAIEVVQTFNFMLNETIKKVLETERKEHN